jgi:shikimate dehydrogenase
VLHTAAYAAPGLGDWTYTAIECDEAGLLASCDRTIPG